MENVILTIHLILALLLIGVVLLQRNEGGALLSGGGAVSARGAATALTKLTWIFAACFIATSITLTVLGTRGDSGNSVVDTALPADAPADAPAAPAAGADLLPPASSDAPAAPPPAADPAAPAAGTTTGETKTTP